MPDNVRITPTADGPNMVVGNFELHWASGSAMSVAVQAGERAIMPERIDYVNVAPKGMHAMLEIERTARSGGLGGKLLELVQLRASQINGCARSLSEHTKDALSAGETEERLALLAVWRKAPVYSDRERAALAWTEAVTRIADHGVPDDVFSQAHKQFTDQELIYLTFAVISINAKNRLNISFRTPVELSGPARHVETAVGAQAAAQ